MDVTVTESQLNLVLNRLDLIRLEILRLRAMLLPEEELTGEEAKELEETRKGTGRARKGHHGKVLRDHQEEAPPLVGR